jgi:hypothetical protein
MSASLLDDIFELLKLATHLEEAKENRVEAATKVCVSSASEQQYLISTTVHKQRLKARLNSRRATVVVKSIIKYVGTDTISFLSFSLLYSFLLPFIHNFEQTLKKSTMKPST